MTDGLGKRFPFVAYGGEVTEDCIICPFHGWHFDGTGHNVAIPYAKTVNRTARLRAWPTVERAGVISARWRFRSHPQAVCENTVDIAHFATVHGVSGARYRDRPQLARGEGAINEFRAWARQSYEEATA